jgi:hypothetical protein
MNQNEAGNTIKRIYSENVDNNICIFIDGEWGIGKTYSVLNEWEKEDEARSYSLKYVSVFGKNDLEQIEKELIMQIMPIFNSLNKYQENNAIKLFGNAVNGAMKLFDKEISLDGLLKNLRIENVSTEKAKERTILCIDDLERKSPNIDIKDLLGLIERASTNFSIIFIANSAKLQNDKESFIEYKEKIIDYQINIDDLDLETLRKVAKLSSENIEEKDIELIAKVYSEMIENYRSLKNIRMFKKCVGLLQQIKDIINREFPNDYFDINEDIVIICIKVIYDHFFPNIDGNEKIGISTNQKKVLFKTFYSIFLYENYDQNVLLDHLIQHSEISKDIRKLYSAYQLNESELEALIDKIKGEIDEENEGYFKEPNLVVSLFDALNSLSVLTERRDKLFDISVSLYSPSCNEEPLYLKGEDWNDFDFLGNEIECSSQTISFIYDLNQQIEEKYNRFIKEEYRKSINEKNILSLHRLLEKWPVRDIPTFESIFDLAFTELMTVYNKDTWSCLYLLVISTKGEFVKQFLEDKEQTECKLSTRLKYTQLLSALKEDEYFSSRIPVEIDSED